MPVAAFGRAHFQYQFIAQIALPEQGERAAQVKRSLEAFLGLGSGLTPSGDDLVMGFMLALTRWGRGPSSAEQISFYTLQLLPRALQRTGHLSASLIACAAVNPPDGA